MNTSWWESITECLKEEYIVVEMYYGSGAYASSMCTCAYINVFEYFFHIAAH